MKSAFILFFLIAILEFTHSSRIEPDDVFTEIQAYGRRRASGLRMMRGGTNQVRCYDTFIPKITELAERGKTESETCIADADAERDVELQKVQEQRSALDERVESVRNSLNACTAEEDLIKYLTCLKNGAEENRLALTEIEETSSNLYQELNESYEAIRLIEHGCIGSVIEKAKEDTDNVFNALQNCLINGYEEPPTEPQPQTDPTEEPQPEPQPDPQPDPTDEPQPEPTEEPQPDPEPGQEPNPDPEPSEYPEEDIN